jgi:hypothetical protein
MNCYICEKTPSPNGTHYHVKVAVGICHNCGIAVCGQHSQREAASGSPLLCPSCARLFKEREDSRMPEAESMLP